jgi:hypothetical protein
LMSRAAVADTLTDSLGNLTQQQDLLRRLQQDEQRTRNNLRTRESR